LERRSSVDLKIEYESRSDTFVAQRRHRLTAAIEIETKEFCHAEDSKEEEKGY
jgi:hypothetical protein